MAGLLVAGALRVVGERKASHVDGQHDAFVAGLAFEAHNDADEDLDDMTITWQPGIPIANSRSATSRCITRLAELLSG